MTERDYTHDTVGLVMKEVNMLFTHDTERSLNVAAALVNTEQPDADELDDVHALDRFVTAWGLTGMRRSDSTELDQVRALRPRLRALWHADEEGVVAAVNGMLREARALPQLVTHDDVRLPPARHAGRRAAGRPHHGRGRDGGRRRRPLRRAGAAARV